MKLMMQNCCRGAWLSLLALLTLTHLNHNAHAGTYDALVRVLFDPLVPAGQCISTLPQFVETVLQQQEYAHTNWGILVQSPSSSSKIYYSHNANTLMTPASNNKVLTSATLFLLTNATQSFTYSTPFLLGYSEPALRSRHASPSLCVQGRGDPSFNFTTFQRVADRLSQQGVTRLKSIVLDQSYLHGAGQPFPCKNQLCFTFLLVYLLTFFF